MKAIFVSMVWACVAATPVSGFEEASLPQLGMGLGGVNYYSPPRFANSLAAGTGWIEYAGWDWGTSITSWGSPQFDVNGYPKYLNPGLKLRAVLFGLHSNYANRPLGWPVRDSSAIGKIVLTWKGDADIQLNGATFLPNESSGVSTGLLVNGRRVYRMADPTGSAWLTVEGINSASPVTDIKVWLPDPADPENRSLEGKLFHPTSVARLRDGPWGFLRFMDWMETNASPLQDWSDRRRPAHAFQSGVLNPRSPANGFGGNRGTGVAAEHMVALCNATHKDLWINVPHLATDDFTTKLAQLIRFGSNGTNPYTSAQVEPVYAPLDSNLRVFVEYSNEIWSGGDAFPQGNWAQDQGAALGLSKGQFNARRFCDVWRLFQNVFGDRTRLVRVAAVFSGGVTYTTDFLNEIKAFGATVNPAQEPDVIAPTTYFGNGIQEWAFAKAQSQAGTSDPWFLTSAMFDAGGGNLRPVSLPATDPYWTGSTVQAHLAETFREWTRRMFSGSAQRGAGPDATGIGGGFDDWLRTLALSVFPTRKPLVSYEGGPSIYTNSMDWGDSRGEGITTFMELLNRQPQMADVYRTHLNMAKAKGLRTHGVFVDVAPWGKYGQWGHLELLEQNAAEAVKWKFLLDWETEMAGVRHLDDTLGTAPTFTNDPKLPSAIWGQSYSAAITTSGGQGPRTVEPIGLALSDGLTLAPVPGFSDQVIITGTPSSTGDNFAYLRVKDGDGDAAWRMFSFRTAGGPRTLLESNFEGSNPARHLPWVATYAKKSGLAFTGWSKGAGVSAADGDDALIYSQDMPPEETDATLTLAVAEAEHWTGSLRAPAGESLDLRGTEGGFTVQRIDYHAPRRYAVFTSVGGFNAGAEVFNSPHTTSTIDQEFVFTLPTVPQYAGLTGEVEFRIYGYAGQYAGHRTSIRAFKLNTARTPAGLTVIASDPTASETGDAASFTVTRSGDLDGNLKVHFTVGGSATEGADFTTIGATLTIPSGAATASLTIAPLSDSLAEGLETATITLQPNDEYVLGTSITANATIADLPLHGWRFTQFGAQANNPAVVAETADPDRDGINNRLEYTLGGNPLVADTEKLMPFTTLGGGPAAPGVQFTYRKAIANGVVYRVVVSPELTTWTDAALEPGYALSPHGTAADNVPLWRATIPQGNRARMFVRLTVE